MPYQDILCNELKTHVQLLFILDSCVNYLLLKKYILVYIFLLSDANMQILYNLPHSYTSDVPCIRGGGGGVGRKVGKKNK